MSARRLGEGVGSESAAMSRTDNRHALRAHKTHTYLQIAKSGYAQFATSQNPGTTLIAAQESFTREWETIHSNNEFSPKARDNFQV